MNNQTNTNRSSNRHPSPSQEEDAPSDEGDSRQAPPRGVGQRFWQFLGRYRKLIVVAAFGNFITVALAMVAPLITKLIIDEALPGKNFPLLLGLAIGFVILQGLRLAIGYGHDFLINYVGQRTVFDIRKTLFHHLQLLHLSFYEK